MNKRGKITLLLISVLAGLGTAVSAWAQNFGINFVANTINLPSGDIRTIILRIIQIALSFLGVIALIIILYAGFRWMTSGGDEEKIGQARKTLRDAIIGLIIIFASWAVVTFVISSLINALGGQGGNINPGGAGNLGGVGVSAIGACTLDSVYPVPGQTDVPRNTSILVSFKEELKLDSICVNDQGAACACNPTACNKLNPQAIQLYKTDLGNACSGVTCSNPNTNVTDILVNVGSGHRNLVLTPLNYLGSPTANTPYTIHFSGQVKNVDGQGMFRNCGASYAEWKFTVSSRLDLTPPIVTPAGVFPTPDNLKDIFNNLSPAKAATANIVVNDCPHIYVAAAVTDISPSGPEVTLAYHGAITKFKISVPAEAPDKAQLFNGDDDKTLLGIADFDPSGQAVFPGYLTFKSVSHPAGSLWTISITPEAKADTLTVGEQIYTFASSSENNNIKVPFGPLGVCFKNILATAMEAKLSGHPEVDVSRDSLRLTLTAKVAGLSGNDIIIDTTNPAALTLTPFGGGTDQASNVQVKDKKDSPMNSVIQINFSEAVNPLNVSGLASDVANYIRVVNADASSSPAGTTCAAASDCRSYKCENGACVGDYINGQFMIANGYKTVEFISDQECGLNGCGEKIYCLPANSHLAVDLVAANLKTCTTDSDCLSLSPFKTCSTTPLGYKTCQNADGQNYPSANVSALDGIMDAALNSLDGNRSAYADGPLAFYNDNAPASQNEGQKDKYLWSFYINDKIMSDSPQISTLTPADGQSSSGLADPVAASFNVLMMNSTLRTGSVSIISGTSTVEHKLINLWSLTPSPLGYWILSDNLDTAPLDSVPDMTIAYINHSPFNQSIGYRSQVGSGVKDIYQNCYKPSAGPNCAATAETPSCCFGTPTSTLGVNGNCK